MQQQAIKGVLRAVSQTASAAGRARALHSTAAPQAFSKFAMPAMSPTMTEGGLATWKVSEGSAFSAGDVLLEIETDKATMDVEAQDDGVMAKIVVQAGEKGVPVGKMIAILAEEGDDLSKAESEVKADEPAAAAPKGEEPSKQPSQSQSSSQSSPPSPSPSHSPAASQPAGSTGHSTGGSTSQMFPSVSRLLAENNISSEQASQIKGSGIRGMLTKGDVLVHLGKADSPTGSYKRGHAGVTSFGGPPPAGKGPAEKSSSSANSAAKASEPKSLSAIELRSAILAGLAATPSRTSQSTKPAAGALQEVIADHAAKLATPTPAAPVAPKKDWLDGIL